MAVSDIPPTPPGDATLLSLSRHQHDALRVLVDIGPKLKTFIAPITRRWLAQRGLIALDDDRRIIYITEFGRMVLESATVRKSRDQIPRSLL